MAQDPLQLLHQRIQRFGTAEGAAMRVLDALETELQHPRVAGFRRFARAPYELLLNFTGLGLYFRFVYSIAGEMVEYGWWKTLSLGERWYVATGEWPVGEDGTVGRFRSPDEVRAALYSTVAEILEQIGHVEPETRRTGYEIGTVAPGLILPVRPPNP